MADKLKFTPGPWLNEGTDASHGVPFIQIAAGKFGTKSYRFICDVCASFDGGSGHSLTPEDYANAALIAEAPRMYVALEALADRLEMLQGKDAPLVTASRAILARASGGGNTP